MVNRIQVNTMLPRPVAEWLEDRARRHSTSRSFEIAALLTLVMDRTSQPISDAKLEELLAAERLIGFELAQESLRRYLNAHGIPKLDGDSPGARLSRAVRTWIRHGRMDGS